MARSGFNESDARWSPDGRWVAYISDEPGRPEIFVERWPQDGRKWRVTSAGGTRPRWQRDGRGLFFLRDGAVMRAELAERGADVSFGTPVRIGWREGDRRHEGNFHVGNLCMQSDGEFNAPRWRDAMTFACASIPHSLVTSILLDRAPDRTATFVKQHCVEDPLAHAYVRSLLVELADPTEPTVPTTFDCGRSASPSIGRSHVRLRNTIVANTSSVAR